jgi:hypothetical protein
VPDYQHLTRDELLNLTQDRKQLTDEARLALDAEISQRRVTADEIQSYARETKAQERAAERRAQRRSSSFVESKNKKLYGKKNYHCDDRKRVEEFETTLWVVLGIPLIPLRSYKIRRLFRKWWNPCASVQIRILKIGPLDWDQVFQTWLRWGVPVLLGFCLLFLVANRRN